MNTTRAVRTRGPDAVDHIRAADRRVGSGAKRARWLLEFVRRARHGGLVGGESIEARWEARAFAAGGLWRVTGNESPPTWREVSQAQIQFQGLLATLGASHRIPARWVGELRAEPDGTMQAMTVTTRVPFLEAFEIQATEVLRTLSDFGLRLRFCPICTRAFLAKRADTKMCPTGSCRTIAWRRTHREEFNATRRRAYRRRQVAKTGRQNLRIQTRRTERREGKS